MEKSTKTVVIIFGLISIATGLLSYFQKGDKLNMWVAIIIGVGLIGAAIFTHTKYRD